MSPLIPMDPEQLPVEFETIPEDTQVRGMIKEAKLGDKTDKNGRYYGVVTWEIVSPVEWEGRQITDNYVGFQDTVEPNMSDGARRRALERGIKFNRICACIKLRPTAVPSNPIDDSDEVNDFLQNELVGQEGDFTVSVNEYEGKKSNRIKEYLLP